MDRAASAQSVRRMFCRRTKWLGAAFGALAGLAAPAAAGGATDGVLHRPTAATPWTPIPVAVFGTDDRVPLPDRYKSLQGHLGLLFNVQSRTVCTAFCVGEDVIATAAHCLYRTAGETAPGLGNFWFARSYDHVRDYARIAGRAADAAAQHVLAGSQKLSTRPPIDATRDWALVKLDRPLCPAHGLVVQPMPPEEILKEAAADRVFQVSYHRDFKQWRMAYSRPCSVSRSFEVVAWEAITQDFAAPEHLLLHTCDTGGASSGSPLFVDTPDGPRVIGINVGTYVQSRTLMQQGEVVQRLKADMVANTGVSAVAFADRIEPFKRAQILGNARQIKDVQRALRTQKIYDGEIDGVYSPALKAGIEAYEQRNQAPVTGLATAALLRQLGGKVPEAPAAVVAKRATMAR
jgi:Trypsin-like peptidase domain/Putative peptidoglycan binding domain